MHSEAQARIPIDKGLSSLPRQLRSRLRSGDSARTPGQDRLLQPGHHSAIRVRVIVEPLKMQQTVDEIQQQLGFESKGSVLSY